MKRISSRAALSLLACAALLGACGGGGDEAGSLTEFSALPSSVTFSGAQCAQNAQFRIFVYGGAAPYRIDSPFEGIGIALDTTQVDHPGGSFTVTFTGAACLDPGSVNVVDKLGRVVVVELISEEADAAN